MLPSDQLAAPHKEDLYYRILTARDFFFRTGRNRDDIPVISVRSRDLLTL